MNWCDWPYQEGCTRKVISTTPSKRLTTYWNCAISHAACALFMNHLCSDISQHDLNAFNIVFINSSANNFLLT
ncbi:MAG: hypothetical protein UZ12_BCD005003409 [Bacteroidetes bacterium OLB12]|nr:MAG: hypothetical protein UZ12_BCD005003409 [Bacteroidetes bacterium OLB12]